MLIYDLECGFESRPPSYFMFVTQKFFGDIAAQYRRFRKDPPTESLTMAMEATNDALYRIIMAHQAGWDEHNNLRLEAIERLEQALEYMHSTATTSDRMNFLFLPVSLDIETGRPESPAD